MRTKVLGYIIWPLFFLSWFKGGAAAAALPKALAAAAAGRQGGTHAFFKQRALNRALHAAAAAGRQGSTHDLSSVP